MLNKTWFKKIQKLYTTYESARREIIKSSGDALSRAKRAIFALHRDDKKTAADLLGEAEELLRAGYKLAEKNIGLEYEGSFRAALEEYAEAKLYYNFLADGTVGEIKELRMDEEIYLGGLADLTGELLRRMVIKATERKIDEVKILKEGIRAIVEELTELDLTGYLRQKFDQAKQSLRRAEEVLYDLSLRS